MTPTRGLTLLLISAALATVVACGGGGSKSKTPAAGTTARATQAGGSAGQTGVAAQTSRQGGTPGGAGSNTSTAAGSAVAGSTSSAPPSHVTVLPDGTATNPQGTPVELPTAQPATSATAVPSARATAQGGPGAVISIVPPADTSGDFTVEVKLDGVTKPYVAFNIYVTFDPSILSAIVIAPGTALAPTPGEQFCERAQAVDGEVGIGCTVLQGAPSATNGVLATIKFHQVGSGTTQLRLRTVAEGASTTGTYIATPRPGGTLLPDIVTLIDGSVTLP